jgi:hypothetical protein
MGVSHVSLLRYPQPYAEHFSTGALQMTTSDLPQILRMPIRRAVLGSDVSLVTSRSQHQLSEIVTCKERSHSIRKLGQAFHYLLSTAH